MKCQHCGKNEVSFVYRSNINGKVEEQCLCAECAEKLGYTRRLAAQRQSLMRGFFGEDDGFFGGGLLGSLLGGGNPFPALMGWDNPFDDFFTEMPALGVPQETQAETPSDTPPEENRFQRWRKVNALKAEMKQAVRREDFERAAQIRDEIKALEADGETA